jgi:stage II sporulation protein D
MIIKAWMFVVAFLPFIAPVEAGFLSNIRSLFGKDQNAVPAIDVLIVNDQPSSMVEVKGKYQLFNPHTKKLISKRFVGKKKLMQPHSGGLKWGEEFPGIFQLMIVPEEPSAVTIVDGVEYKGNVTIYDIGGSISIVNRVPIEDFMRSTLPSKYPEPMPEEVMASIAIVARTDYYYYSQYPKNKFWAVDGIGEGYQGNNSVHPSAPMDLAILSTRYMVLSQTGAYEGRITPFSAHWNSMEGRKIIGTPSRISIYEAEDIARNGGHAAQILSKAFPGSHIELIY